MMRRGASVKSLPGRVRSGLRVLVQILALIAVWSLASWLVQALDLPVSAGVAGLLMVLALLLAGVIKVNWVRRGAEWMLGELVLFFIPSVVAVVQYGDLFRHQGVALVGAVVIGTLLVMVSTALVVHLACGLEYRLALRARHRRWIHLRHERLGELL